MSRRSAAELAYRRSSTFRTRRGQKRWNLVVVVISLMVLAAVVGMRLAS